MPGLDLPLLAHIAAGVFLGTLAAQLSHDVFQAALLWNKKRSYQRGQG